MDLVTCKISLNSYLFMFLWSIIYSWKILAPLTSWIMTPSADLSIFSIKEIDHISGLNYVGVDDLPKLTKVQFYLEI